MKCRITALKEELQRQRELLLEHTTVREYDNIHAKIAFLKDTLQRYNPVKEMPVKVTSK